MVGGRWVDGEGRDGQGKGWGIVAPAPPPPPLAHAVSTMASAVHIPSITSSSAAARLEPYSILSQRLVCACLGWRGGEGGNRPDSNNPTIEYTDDLPTNYITIAHLLHALYLSLLALGRLLGDLHLRPSARQCSRQFPKCESAYLG